MRTLQTIDPARLVPMDLFTASVPLRVDVAYTQDVPKSFCGVIYRPDARLWLHEDLAVVVVHAAVLAGRTGRGLILYDGLRTVEAQALMRDTPIVRAHPHWLEGATRMLSPPGKGAHPRGMAIDLTLCDGDGVALDMGTAFDAMPEKGPGPEDNAAHRDTVLVGPDIRAHRDELTRLMMAGALAAGQFLLPLPQEWWDYRFPATTYDMFAPLSDADLPPQMRMVAADAAGTVKDFPDTHFVRLRDNVLRRARA